MVIIDDEEYVRAALQRVLSSAKIEVGVAAEAGSGMALVRELRADIVIVDIVLPGMDGVAAIAQMRQEFPQLAIVAISGGGNFGLSEYQPDAISTKSYLAASTAAGADAVIAKPFETREIYAQINKALASKGIAQAI